MKGKFIYVYKDGSKMIDRNGYKTIVGAKGFMKAHNNNTRYKKDKIVRVIKVIRVKSRK